MSQPFTAPAIKRLLAFLEKNFQPAVAQPLTPDASTREYFRINWHNKSAVACAYPEPFNPLENPYVDVTTLFQAGNLPVAEIYTIDGDAGLIILEDFGDRILRNVLAESEPDEREKLINKAITLIAEIQVLTGKAFESNSIASRLRFDEEKLLWELNFFKTHFFESLQKEKLTEKENKALTAEFTELSRELEKHAKVLCHRDFHAANLMIDEKNNLRIIDHQDARIGSVAYDLVSLLLDRILEPPAENWLNEKKRFLLAKRENLGLEAIDEEAFEYEFELMTVQRCLKAIGTFSNQAANCGKPHYLQFINPMFEVVLNSCRKLDSFPNLQQTIERLFVK